MTPTLRRLWQALGITIQHIPVDQKLLARAKAAEPKTGPPIRVYLKKRATIE